MNYEHDLVMQEKINHASDVIEKVLDRYKNPCVLCSFGKDSMLMLHMIREWFTKYLPVVFFKQAQFTRKFAFGERVAADLDIDLYTCIPPVGVSVTSKNGKSELVQHFQIGAKQLLMPIGRQKIEGAARWLCAEETLSKGPWGSFNWPWDVAFCGHKSSDVDPVQGEVPLACDIHQIAGSCDLAFPLRHFTDAEVWKLSKQWNIPINRLAYGEGDEPNKDTENFWNSDYVPYCMACVDPAEAAFVKCPKTGLEITNIHSSLLRTDPKLQYAGGN